MVLTLQVKLGASKAHKLSDVPWPQLWPDNISSEGRGITKSHQELSESIKAIHLFEEKLQHFILFKKGPNF